MARPITFEKAAEVGNIFDIGTTFSESFGMSFCRKRRKKALRPSWAAMALALADLWPL